MKNLKIVVLFASSIIASQSNAEIADVVLKAISPFTGFVVGALNLGSHSERLLTGMVVSAPSAIVYGKAFAAEDKRKAENNHSGFRSSPYYLGCFIGELITYGVGIGLGTLARVSVISII